MSQVYMKDKDTAADFAYVYIETSAGALRRISKDAFIDAVESLLGGGSDYTLPTATESKLGGVMPVAKTSAMTQDVGVDSEGKLYTAPGSGTGSSYTLPAATADDLGGIKADAKTDTDTVPAKIGEDGKLYVPTYPTGGESGAWENVMDITLEEAVKSIVIPDLTAYSQILIYMYFPIMADGTCTPYFKMGTAYLSTKCSPSTTTEMFYIAQIFKVHDTLYSGTSIGSQYIDKTNGGIGTSGSLMFDAVPNANTLYSNNSYDLPEGLRLIIRGVQVKNENL